MNQESAQPSMVDASEVSLLMVDDEPNILTALKRVFRPLNYRIFTAGSGAEGLEILEQRPIDLVISDMRMPEMDGATFLGRVAAKWSGTIRVLLTGQADLGSTIAAINKGKIYRYVSKPWEDNDLRLTVTSGLEQKFLEQERRRLERTIYCQNEELREFNSQLEEKVAQRTRELAELHEALKGSYEHTVKMFASLLEAREPFAAGHSSRVGEEARRVALHSGMNDKAAEDVQYAGILHDMGKVALPDFILKRPWSALTADERRTFKEHPRIAHRVLMLLDPLQEAALLVRHHCEHYDGSGFPEGLKGDEIPLGARILAVINDYHELQLGFLREEKYTPAQARAYLNDHSGSHYDPMVIASFFEILDQAQRQGEIGWIKVTTSELRKGMRLAENLLAKDGILLLSKGYVLDEKMVRKIRNFEKLVQSRLELFIAKDSLGTADL